MEINIIYNEFKKSIVIDILKKNGVIQENLLSLCSLMIYNIEYSEIIIDSKSYIIGLDDFPFEETLEKSLEKIDQKQESIEKIIINDRKRDECGNVIKKNDIIDKYNIWFQDYENENYINFINSQNGYNRNNSSRNIIQFPIDSLLNNILRSPLYTNYRNELVSRSNDDNDNLEETINNQQNESSREIMSIIDKKLDELNNELNNNDAYNDAYNEEGDNEDNNEEGNDENEDNNEEGNDENEDSNEDAQINQQSYNNLENNQSENFNNSMQQFNNIINIFDNYIQNNINIQQNSANSFFNVINQDMNLNYYNFNQFTNLSNLVNEDLVNEDLDDLPDLINMNEEPNNGPILYTTFSLNPLSHNNYVYEDVKIILSDEQFNNLECKSFKELNLGESKECLICIENFNDDDDVIKIPCNHIFHKNCIKSWVCEESNKCPICRVEVNKGIQK
jgi:hypothetical protein